MRPARRASVRRPHGAGLLTRQLPESRPKRRPQPGMAAHRRFRRNATYFFEFLAKRPIMPRSSGALYRGELDRFAVLCCGRAAACGVAAHGLRCTPQCSEAGFGRQSRCHRFRQAAAPAMTQHTEFALASIRPPHPGCRAKRPYFTKANTSPRRSVRATLNIATSYGQ